MPEFNPGGRRLAIKCSPEVMEVVRAAVMDGYFRLKRGGLEVGGVLFGRRDGGTVHVEASLPFPCQYAYGPTFTLSVSDLAELAKLLKASSIKPELRGLEPVGWYHSHTRSDLEFSERDLELHNRFFPETWQVALVLRPEWPKPARAAFFVRDAQGILRQDPEFVVQPLSGVPRTVLAAPVELPHDPPAPPAGPPALAVAEAPPSTVEPPLPSFAQSPTPGAKPGHGWWLLFALAWTLAAVNSAIALRGCWFPRPPAALQVSLQDTGGQLVIQWNQQAQAIQDAEGGVLEIQDGDRKRILKMSASEIRGASVVVSRQSGRVTVRLRANLPRGRTAEGWALFEGEPVEREPAPANSGEPKGLGVH